jgi:hypothetical protein
MKGDDKVRTCAECRLNVYNFAGMSQREGEELIRTHEGRLCVRIWRRPDGTLITKDCPVGLRALKRKARWMAGQIAAGALLTLGLSAWVLGGTRTWRSGETPSGLAATRLGRPFVMLREWVNPPPRDEIILGFSAELPF